MTDLPLAGGIRSALAHLAAVGLTSILRDAGDRSARFWWDVETARPRVRSSLSQDQIAATVIAHAEARAEQSWVTAKIAEPPRHGMSLFSPRIKAAQLDRWGDYVAARNSWHGEDRSMLTSLDFRMLASIGEPAWWRCDSKDTRPDDGASRWEMKTRNRGEDFLSNRLAPLTDVVAQRNEYEVISGLTGVTQVDELAKVASESRTATGLTAPRAADSAVAYSALWGIAALRTVHKVSEVSSSAGMRPRRRVHPRWAYLPVFIRRVTPAHYAAIAASRAFDEVGRRACDFPDGTGVSGEIDWLGEQGVYAIVVFQIKKSGSASAPERQILNGDVFML